MADNKVFEEIQFRVVRSSGEFDDARNLFRQYASSLKIDLCFQNFDEELRTIEVQYNKPAGALVIAYLNECPVGCAAIRKLDIETAELKRMFVLPEHMHHHLEKNFIGMVFNNSEGTWLCSNPA